MDRLSDIVRGRYNHCKYCGAYNVVTGKCAITGRKVVSFVATNTRVDICPKDKR